MGSSPIQIVDGTIYPTGISITGPSSLTANSTAQYNIEYTPSCTTNKSVTWSITSGSDYATIDQNGLVTGVAEGTVKIKAVSQSNTTITSLKTITVSNVVTTPYLAIDENETIINSEVIKASMLPSGDACINVTWSILEGTSNATIGATSGLVTATVDGSIKVQAISNTDETKVATSIVNTLVAASVARNDYSPDGAVFSDSIDCSFGGGQYIDITVDSPNCSGQNENILGVGNNIVGWKTDLSSDTQLQYDGKYPWRMFVYYNTNAYTKSGTTYPADELEIDFLYRASSTSFTSARRQITTYCALNGTNVHFQIKNDGVYFNGTLLTTSNFTQTPATYTNFVAQLASTSTIIVGSAQGTTRSHGLYYDIAVKNS